MNESKERKFVGRIADAHSGDVRTLALSYLNRLDEIEHLTAALADAKALLTGDKAKVYAILTELRGQRNDAMRAADKARGALAESQAVCMNAYRLLMAAPELNMANYTEDQVSHLNTAVCEACCVLEGEASKHVLAARGEEAKQ